MERKGKEKTLLLLSSVCTRKLKDRIAFTDHTEYSFQICVRSLQGQYASVHQKFLGREGGREGAHSLLTASSRLFEMAMKPGLCPAQIWTWCEKNHTTRDIWDLGCRPAILGKTKLCLCHWSGTLMWPFLQGFPTHQAKWLPRTPVHCKVEVVLIRASDNLGFFKADT